MDISSDTFKQDKILTRLVVSAIYYKDHGIALGTNER
jgi:hypothetical protein